MSRRNYRNNNNGDYQQNYINLNKNNFMMGINYKNNNNGGYQQNYINNNYLNNNNIFMSRINYKNNNNGNYQNNYLNNNNEPSKTIKEMTALLENHRKQIDTYLQYLYGYDEYFRYKNAPKYIVQQFNTIRTKSLEYMNIDERLQGDFNRAQYLCSVEREVNKEPIKLTEESILNSINKIDEIIMEQRGMAKHDHFSDHVIAYIERFETNINNFINQSKNYQQLSKIRERLTKLISDRTQEYCPRAKSSFYTGVLKYIVENISIKQKELKYQHGLPHNYGYKQINNNNSGRRFINAGNIILNNNSFN